MLDFRRWLLPAVARACVFVGSLLGVASPAAAGADPGELKPGQGLLLVAIDNAAAAWSVRIEGPGIAGDGVIKDLQPGRNVRLLKVPAGQYRFSQIARSDEMRFSTDFPDSPHKHAHFAFTVEAGAINYPGDLVLRMTSPHRISANRLNKSAFAMAMLDHDSPGVRARLPWRNDVAAPDPFPAFLTARIDAAGMARLVESSPVDARKTRDRPLDPGFAAVFKDLFVPQTAAAWPQINPAGTLLAYRDVRVNQEAAVVVDLATGESTKVFAVPGTVDAVLWAGDRSLIVGFRRTLTGILAQSPGKKTLKPTDAAAGIELMRLGDAGPPREDAITRVRYPDVSVVDALPDDPERFIAMRSDEDGSRHLFALDKRGGHYNPLEFRPGRRLEGDLGKHRLLRGFVDAKGVLRAAMVVFSEGDKASVALMRRDGETWARVRDLPLDDVFDPVALSADGTHMTVRTDTGRDQVDIVRFPLDGSAADETVLSLPGVNISVATVRPRDRAVLGGYVYRTGVARLHYLDGDARLPKGLAASFPRAQLAVVDESRDGAFAILDVHTETGPNAFYLYDAKNRRVEKLLDAREPLARVQAAKSVALTLPGANGAGNEAYLTLPAGGGPFPLVVVPAGAGERYVFDPTLQLFVHNGFAVLRVGQIADADAALDAALATHPLDRARVALFGSGLGGSEALMKLAQSPQRYRCGVAVSPITDFALLFSSSVWNARELAVERFKRRFGDPATALDALRAKSPVYQFDKLTAPLLLIHGTEDVNVSFEHSWRLRSLLAGAGRPPEWLPLPGADDSLSQPADRLALHAASDDFLRRCLSPQGAPAAGANTAASGL